jgi:signal peptidase
MEPTLREKSVCIVKQSTYDEVDVGDIIMYTIEEKTITHRIVDKTEDGIRTRGDNNNVQDAYLIQPDQINGKVVMVFNFTATIINDLQSGVYGYVKWIGFPIFSIVVIVVTVKVIKKILNSGDDDEDDQKKDKKKEKSEKEPAKIEESEPKSEEE